MILDNLSAHKAKKIKAWCAKNNVELCFYSSHTGLTRRVHGYLRWRNENARAPEVLAALRKRRAEIRAEQQRRWGRPRPRAA